MLFPAMNRVFLILFVLVASTVGVLAQQGPKILTKPKAGYVLDKAELLNSETIKKINLISAASASGYQSPIYVVTIPSLASVHAPNVEAYATILFNYWEIGNRTSNRGILLLVAKSDRRARIELGAGWGYGSDQQSAGIMSSRIVPKFKAGDYAGGVLAGVHSLSDMVRNPPSEAQPTYYEPSYQYEAVQSSSDADFLSALVPVIFFLVLIAIVIAKNGGGGGGWNSTGPWYGGHRHYGGGSFHSSGGSFGGSSSGSSGRSSGGSSGGGFSNGGGASGSW